MQYNFLFSFPQGWLLIVSAIINLCWIFYIFSLEKSISFTRHLLLPFVFLAVCFDIWIFTNVYFHSQLLLLLGENSAIAMAKISNVAGGFVAITFFYISYILKNCWNSDFKKISLLSGTFIVIVSLVNIILHLVPDLVFTGVEIYNDHQNGFVLIQGNYFFLFHLVCLVFPIIPAIFNLSTASKIKDIRYFVSLCILAGVLVCYSSALICSAFIPLFFDYYRLTWIPPFLAFVPVSLFGYAISDLWMKEFKADTFGSITLLAYSLALCGFIVFLALLGLKGLVTGQISF